LAHNYDAYLFHTQILLCLQSSSIPWPTFTIVGYSLGGAIAADFTSYFPSMVRGLVLVAPGGLIRRKHISISSSMLYRSSWMPEWMVGKFVASRLWTGLKRVEPAPDALENAETTTTTASEGNKKYQSSNQMLLPGNPHSTVSSVVDWQVKNHKGFVPAFISTMRHAPIHNQQARWNVIRENIERRAGPLREVWLVLGETDPIVVADEITEDARAALGDYVRVKTLEGAGHEVAIERADDIVRVVRSIGKSSSSSGGSTEPREPERAERPEKPEKAEKAEKAEKSEKSEKSDKKRRKHGSSHAGGSSSK
jgi:pimeloyl-ACP methyl ester carboxylesterase